MLKKFASALMLTLAIGVFSLTSCRKDKEPAVQIQIEEQENTTDHTNAELSFDDVDNVSNDATAINSNDLARVGANEDVNQNAFGCAQVTNIERGINPTTNRPFRRFTLDFGNGSMPCRDGKVRKGKINVNISLPVGYNNPLRIPLHLISGAEKAVTFDNYFVDNVKVEGNIVVNNLTEGQITVNLNTGQFSGVTGNLKYRRRVTNGKLTFPNNTTFNWTADRTVEWVEGWNSIANLQNPFNDKFHVYGTYSGTNRRGTDFAATVAKATPLVINTGCNPRVNKPVSGVLTLIITPTNRPIRTLIINYGNGNCDKTYTITIGNNTITVNG